MTPQLWREARLWRDSGESTEIGRDVRVRSAGVILHQATVERRSRPLPALVEPRLIAAPSIDDELFSLVVNVIAIYQTQLRHDSLRNN